MPDTKKLRSEYDQSQIIQKVYNSAEGTLGVSGFLAGGVGRKIECVQVSGTIEQYEYYDSDNTLLQIIEIEYNNSSHDLLVRAESLAI